MNNSKPASPPGPMMVLVPLGHQGSNSTTKTKVKCIPALTTFSSISIIFGVTSICLQIFILWKRFAFQGSLNHVGSGIWAGVLYVISGSLGLGSASKKTRALFASTVVFSSLSIAASASAAALSGSSIPSIANYIFIIDEYYIAEGIGLQWGLLAISILAFVNSITLTSLASVALSEPPVQQITQPVYAVLPNGYSDEHSAVYTNQAYLPNNSTQAVEPMHNTIAFRPNVSPPEDRQRQKYSSYVNPISRQDEQTLPDAMTIEAY